VSPYPSTGRHETRMLQNDRLEPVANGGPGHTTRPIPFPRRTVMPDRGLMCSSQAPVAAAIGVDRMPNRHTGIADRRLPRIRWLWALAALATVAVSAGGVDPMRVHYYETALTEHRTISCRNSLITLNTQSQVAIQCTRNLLRARVLRGGASFQVAHDPSSAAIVLAGDARVDGTGTIFSVRQDPDRSSVTVMEGSVTLSALDSRQQGIAPRDVGRGRSLTPARTIDEMPVWSGQRAAVVNTGSKVFLATAHGASDQSTR
jgi:ferric-dicitrate binding protein FerR (iron transport regulator)